MAGFGATVGRLRQGVETRSGQVPFRVKKYATYLLIFVGGALLFSAFEFDTQFMRDWLPFILGGVPLTLLMCFGGIALAIPLALLGALGKLSKNAFFNGMASFYISFIRGTPLIAQIFFIYFAFPELAFSPGAPEWLQPLLVYDIRFAGMLALGINYGAYMSEIFRAGIQSVGHGQIEGAHALGMSGGQTLRRIVLPQAVRVVIPPTGNEFIAMLKDSALVGLAGSVTELFNRAQTVGKAESRSLETLLVAALIYWALTSFFSIFQRMLERRYSRGHVREEFIAH